MRTESAHASESSDQDHSGTDQTDGDTAQDSSHESIPFEDLGVDADVSVGVPDTERVRLAESDEDQAADDAAESPSVPAQISATADDVLDFYDPGAYEPDDDLVGAPAMLGPEDSEDPAERTAARSVQLQSELFEQLAEVEEADRNQTGPIFLESSEREERLSALLDSMHEQSDAEMSDLSGPQRAAFRRVQEVQFALRDLMEAKEGRRQVAALDRAKLCRMDASDWLDEMKASEHAEEIATQRQQLLDLFLELNRTIEKTESNRAEAQGMTLAEYQARAEKRHRRKKAMRSARRQVKRTITRAKKMAIVVAVLAAINIAYFVYNNAQLRKLRPTGASLDVVGASTTIQLTPARSAGAQVISIKIQETPSGLVAAAVGHYLPSKIEADAEAQRKKKQGDSYAPKPVLVTYSYSWSENGNQLDEDQSLLPISKLKVGANYTVFVTASAKGTSSSMTSNPYTYGAGPTNKPAQQEKPTSSKTAPAPKPAAPAAPTPGSGGPAVPGE